MRYDVVVWGATGFTGALAAEYLARTVGRNVPWAIAGRSKQKLEALRDRLPTKDVPMIVADAGDPESLRALARQAKAVVTTVGPYAVYGSDLVAACVSEGAHYADLTGEPHWVRQMIDAHHETAREKGVRIVHACGFDSIPSDLGTFLVQERAREVHGRAMPDVRTYVRRVKGGTFSGGSVASMATQLEAAASNKATRRVLGDPYSLLPAGAQRGPDVRDAAPARWDPDERAWLAPFIMATMNSKMVRRSAALLGTYGEGFRYSEAVAYRKGIMGWWRANGAAVGLGTAVAVMSSNMGRRVAARFLPEPGEGPSPEEQAAGSFEFQVVGRGPDAQGHPVEVRVIVRGDKDPGYGSTSGMLAESGLCLAADTLPERFGVLTPATAMGKALADRLPRAGVTFTTR